MFCHHQKLTCPPFAGAGGRRRGGEELARSPHRARRHPRRAVAHLPVDCPAVACRPSAEDIRREADTTAHLGVAAPVDGPMGLR